MQLPPPYSELEHLKIEISNLGHFSTFLKYKTLRILSARIRIREAGPRCQPFLFSIAAGVETPNAEKAPNFQIATANDGN